MRRRFFGRLAVGLAGLLGLGGGPASAGFLLTANAPGSEASTVSGVTTETFDGFKAGGYTTLATAVGTLNSPGLEVVAANQYGGAGGKGDYFAVGAQSGQLGALLTLNAPQAYFGFWWSAADAENEVVFLSGGQAVATFNSTSALASLGSAYDGNPSGGGDAGEKFAYLNFIGTGGSTFDQVAFLNQGTGTGFESDNWSIRAAPLDPGSYPGTPLGPGAMGVPEPSSLLLTAAGTLGLLGLARVRRSR